MTLTAIMTAIKFSWPVAVAGIAYWIGARASAADARKAQAEQALADIASNAAVDQAESEPPKGAA